MKIKLITADQHVQLLNVYENYPALTFQNKGYEGIDKNQLTDEEKEKIKEVEIILNESIYGFSSFQNFKLSAQNEIRIRFQYDYGADDESRNPHHFTGVGYLFLDELLNGFR